MYMKSISPVCLVTQLQIKMSALSEALILHLENFFEAFLRTLHKAIDGLNVYVNLDMYIYVYIHMYIHMYI